MTEYQPPSPPPAPADSATPARRPHRPRLGRFLLIWVALPALYAGGLLLWGMHLAARNPDAWYVVTVRWLLGE